MGYARESATATLALAHERLGIVKVLAIASPTNTRSIHLLEKIGFQFDRLYRQDEEALMLFAKVLDHC